MSERDIFREVEEDLRREQMARLWDKYGVYVLAVAAVVVLFVGAFKGYQWYQAKLATENGAAFFQASTLVSEQKYADARTVLEKLGKNAPGGYSVLAKLELAGLHAKEGRRSEAVSAYDRVAADSGADMVLKDFARVQSATLRLDEAEPAEMTKRLDKLDADANPWRYSARELLALSAYRSGNTAESEKLFTKILSDPFAPAEMRRRAESMLALLVKVSSSMGAQGDPQKDNATSAPKDAATQ